MDGIILQLHECNNIDNRKKLKTNLKTKKNKDNKY